jgi:hypothetical protein
LLFALALEGRAPARLLLLCSPLPSGHKASVRFNGKPANRPDSRSAPQARRPPRSRGCCCSSLWLWRVARLRDCCCSALLFPLATRPACGSMETSQSA